MRKNTVREAGFTLMELLVAVAIVGVLASVAIPSFINYQMTSKRAEAYANLAALAKSQKTYFAEFNQFVASAPEPGATSLEAPGQSKRDVAPLTSAYNQVGWTPDGAVFFDYETVTSAVPGCSCTTCFTTTAYGNLDEDMWMSEFAYFHADPSGGSCDNGVGMHGPPIDPTTMAILWDTVVRHQSSDQF